MVTSTLIVLTSAFAVPPTREAATGTEVAETFLLRPLTYVLIAPLSDVLDMLTLMSVAQHIALVTGIVLILAAWRALVRWRLGSTWRRDAKASAILLATIVVAYVAAAILPRPMALLELAPLPGNANVLRIDFHSHTLASHDGRPGWSVEDSREWHRAAGYDVVYVTDHGIVSAAEEGMANNPAVAAEGVMVLQGVEAAWSGEHVTILSAERTYRGILTNNGRDVDEQGLRLASIVRDREPVVIWNHPHRLTHLPFAKGPRTAGVRGIEVSNGALNSMHENRRHRDQIVRIAEQHGLAMTGGSDNHGWGKTAPNWTLMLIPNWRALRPDALAARIESDIRMTGIAATRVVERRVANPGASKVSLSLTVFGAPLRMLTTLSFDERVMWLVWAWLLTGLAWWTRRRRAV